MNSPEISIVIPVANEAAELPACRARIGGVPHEVIVVAAGSEDATAAVARDAGCLVLAAPERQRARQMNLGAAEARGRILLFLHADTWLPPGALGKILAAIDRNGAIGGGFSRRYRSRSLTLALTARLATVRNRLFGWHLGDQAIFVRRDVFSALGGYREIPIFEDLDFSRRLRARGRTVTLMPPVSSSARRFTEAGPLRRTLADLRLTSRYLAGVAPNDLCKMAGVPVDRGEAQTYE
ncbi:MAG: TIGR04283 family arsenosugar biosynthesis glycosyltransferase [Chthoniobacterales bacterium]